MASLGPSEMTLKHLASLEESEEDENDEGTAKIVERTQASDRRDSETVTNPTRLSSMFENWFIPTSAGSPIHKDSSPRFGNKMNVSEPKLVEHSTGSNLLRSDHFNISDDEDVSDVTFTEMLVIYMYLFLPHF